LVDFYDFCANGKRNECPTIYLLTVLMTHNCITLNATKVYFMELLLNIELSLEIKSWSKTFENVKDFLPEDWQKNLYKKN